MSDHLPECPWANRGFAFPCICDRLRACEQRAYGLGRAHERERNMVVDHEHREESYAIGYAAGVQAAREAVERVSSLLQPLGPALAAIDALKEDK